jgi:hypothetical protein
MNPRYLILLESSHTNDERNFVMSQNKKYRQRIKKTLTGSGEI